MLETWYCMNLHDILDDFQLVTVDNGMHSLYMYVYIRYQMCSFRTGPSIRGRRWASYKTLIHRVVTGTSHCEDMQVDFASDPPELKYVR